MSIVNSKKPLLSQIALWNLGFKQTLKGALIIGTLAGLIAIIQGLGYASTYPDAQSKTAFATALEAAPALGILYGETDNLTSAAGYMVYRVMPFMALICSIWGLMTATKLIRGQEEDGRWEIITASSTTPRQASWLVSLGFGSSIVVALTVCTSMLAAAGTIPTIGMSISTSILFALAIFLPAILFGGIGIFTSQLAITRRRAVMYGLIPLSLFFGIRVIANTLPDFYWLKDLTPFGWSDLISPVITPQIGWLIPFLVTTPLFVVAGIYLAGKRDLSASIIPESNFAKSHLILLGSSIAFAFRQNIPLFLGWGVATLFTSILLAGIMTVAAESVASSPSLAGIISQLGGSATNIKVAFLGAGLVFVVILLLIMATSNMASIRKDEAKNYLDNLLTQPIRRTSWLASRLLLTFFTCTFISLLCVFVTWLIAYQQDISLDLGNMLLIGIALTGTIIFTIGFGTLVYGFAPRMAAIGMYIIIIWSFLIDVVGSVITLNDILTRSSLFHYVSLSPAAPPDWITFAWLALFGTLMAVGGIILFAKRDIVTE